MTRVIAAVRRAQTHWANGQVQPWLNTGMILIEHLLDPTVLCTGTDPQQSQRVVVATKMFLSYIPSVHTALPDAATFGQKPVLRNGDGSLLTPDSLAADAAYWATAQTTFVPPNRFYGEEPEAEALRACPLGRDQRLRPKGRA